MRSPRALRRGGIAFLFPGSGSQYLGMGRDFNGEIGEVRSYLDILARELGVDLRRTMFDGPAELLQNPATTKEPWLFMQAISALSLAVAHALQRRGVVADALAGRSMGEYTALMAAGCVERREGFRLLRCFAEQAQEDWALRRGCVLTVYGLGRPDAERLCRQVVRSGEACELVCHYGARRMAVVGGSQAAVSAFETLAQAAGATRSSRSREEGAIHTTLTSGLARRMARELSTAALRDPVAPIWCNYDARPAATAAVLRHRAAAQLDHPVLWEETISGMAAAGMSVFVEIAPGRMLTDFLVPLPAGVEVLSTDTPARLQEALKRLGRRA